LTWRYEALRDEVNEQIAHYMADHGPEQMTCTACGGSGVAFSPAHEASSRHACGCCDGAGWVAPRNSVPLPDDGIPF
jgi:DnaJ-class molecular chaperone